MRPSDSGFIPGERCVAVPIKDAEAVSAAIAVTVPADRFYRTKDELTKRVVATSGIPASI